MTLTASPEQTGDSRPSTEYALEVTPGDHLLRCMQAVQELASSISCAMDAWQGQPKPGNSDVHGSFANVTACFDELPRMLECTSCKRCVIWPKFNSGGAQGSRSTCTCLTSPSSVKWKRAAKTRNKPLVFAHLGAPMTEASDENAKETTTALLSSRKVDRQRPPKLFSDDFVLPPPPPRPRQQSASLSSQNTSTTGPLRDLVPYPGACEPDTDLSATYIPSGSSYGPDIGLPRAETTDHCRSPILREPISASACRPIHRLRRRKTKCVRFASTSCVISSAKRHARPQAREMQELEKFNQINADASIRLQEKLRIHSAHLHLRLHLVPALG